MEVRQFYLEGVIFCVRGPYDNIVRLNVFVNNVVCMNVSNNMAKLLCYCKELAYVERVLREVSFQGGSPEIFKYNCEKIIVVANSERLYNPFNVQMTGNGKRVSVLLDLFTIQVAVFQRF